jgi:hypothetical protein
MTQARIKPVSGTRRRRSKKYNPTLWVETTYSALVSYERPFLETDKDGVRVLSIETVEMSVPVEAYTLDDARTAAWKKICHLTNAEIKRVDELPQAVHMQRIGAPRLFAMAV